MTRIPLSPAYLTISAMSDVVYVPAINPVLRLVSNGYLSSSTAKRQLSDRCKCRTFILTVAIASRTDFIVCTGQNRRPVSAMKALRAKRMREQCLLACFNSRCNHNHRVSKTQESYRWW